MKQFRNARKQRGVIQLGGIGIVLTLAFVFWCALGTRGEQRMGRICSPFSVTSNLFTSIAALLYDGSEVPTKEVFDNLTYGCRYTVWRLSYEKDWQKYVDKMEKEGKPLPKRRPMGEAADQSAEAVEAPHQDEPIVKPDRPAIDVKGAVHKVGIPSLPAFPGMGKKEEKPEQKNEEEEDAGSDNSEDETK